MIHMIPLPYPLNALEPYYNKETLEIHYHTLYKGYVDNTNKTLEKLEKARLNNQFESIKCLERDLSFYGSGAILHELFFTNMGVPMPSLPSNALMEQIIKDLEALTNAKINLQKQPKQQKHHGWCILAWVPNFQKLEILQCEKHQNLTLWGCKPLLVLDMWEHSYFLQYKANRAEYIQNFKNILNWKEVNKRFEKLDS